MSNSVRTIRNKDLAPTWTVKQAKEPGFMRSLITWVGGPDGYINTNPEVAVTSQSAAVGLMRMAVGNRQAGVHIHSITEIYVILKGEVESFDGVGNLHRAGPLDCLYIPAGVPHAVRTIGDTDLELVWLHDAIEKIGVSVYLDGPGPFPADDEVKLIRFIDLAPDWSGVKAKEGGHLRWSANWVAGPEGTPDHNEGKAVVNSRLAVGVTVILPGNSHVSHAHPYPETYVAIRGSAVAIQDGPTLELGRLDAIYFPPETQHALRNSGDEPLYLLWVHEDLARWHKTVR
jgi:mannose-6-phosphate isomerase-like protein (cupin superfamily)